MGKISTKRRRFEIRKKQKLRIKLKKLRERYFSDEVSETEKEKIVEKMKRLAPHLQIEKYLEIFAKKYEEKGS